MPPVYPITLYTPTQLGHYPHMAKRDAEIWTPFLEAHAAEFLGFSYDVALGGTALALPGEDEAQLLAWKYSTALKIDAVGWKGNQAWIIEVRPDATTSALGAALCYTFVAKREALTELVMIPTIVCRNIQPDVEWTCDQLGVQVIKV